MTDRRNLVAENWRLEKSRYAMVGSHCKKCDVFYFPNAKICNKCGVHELHDHKYTGKGKLVEWTKITEPARGFEMFAPIYYAIVELEEGIKIAVQLASVKDEEKLVPGANTEMVFRRLFTDGDQGIVTYGFKAKPIQ
ncbi:MAG: Zn-ribbon domain-containing OB-fold protein [Candidatus Heimdallarchaeota archaeon]